MKGLNSRLIHGESGIAPFGTLKPSIYQSAAFEFESAEAIEQSFAGLNKLPAYSRSANPTVLELESRLKILSGARNAICVSSGMAAISNLVFALCKTGDNIITSRFLFGNSLAFFVKTIQPFGIDIKFVDFDKPVTIASQIDSNTRMIFMESITNPQLQVADFEKVTTIAYRNGILTVIDNTLLTSYVFDSKKYGFDIEIMSTTKYVSGGATSIGGVTLFYETEKYKNVEKLSDFYQKFGQDALFAKLRRDVYRNMGACLSSESAWLQILGLETMTLRIDKTIDNALKTAEFLTKHTAVIKVIYPGLETDQNYANVQKYFGGKGGCIINFELGSRQDCFTFLNKLQMIKRATNMCDNKSLIIHPHSTIFGEFTEDEKTRCSVNDRQIRFSVGIEDLHDIFSDLEQALS